jgi:OHCU decarboxylase
VETPLTIAAVNQLDQPGFVATFGHVVEDAPSLAEAAWRARPFADVAALSSAFGRAIESLGPDAALALVRAHPELGFRGPMAPASVAEQRSAGLDHAGSDVLARLRRDNDEYRERFGFPFVLAVRGRSVEEIAANLEARLSHAPEAELDEALRQVGQIAAGRVEQIVAPS